MVGITNGDHKRYSRKVGLALLVVGAVFVRLFVLLSQYLFKFGKHDFKIYIARAVLFIA